MLRRLALAGVAVLLVGSAPLAQTPEPAQDNSIEAVQTRASVGDADAQNSLAGSYHFGWDVPQDDVEAYKWFNLATAYADASEQKQYAEARDAVSKRLTPEQRAEGRKRAREWFEAHPPE